LGAIWIAKFPPTDLIFSSTTLHPSWSSATPSTFSGVEQVITYLEYVKLRWEVHILRDGESLKVIFSVLKKILIKKEFIYLKGAVVVF